MAVVSSPLAAKALPTIGRRVTLDGTAYNDTGKGEPLVLIHGVGMRLDAWAPQIDALSRTHRVIAVDMPGHGRSAALPGGSDLKAFVDWLGRFIDALSLDRVNLAGHSMGALISGGAVSTFPERIRRVALLNGVHRRDAAAKSAVLERAASIASTGIDIDGPVQRWFADDAASAQARELTREWLSLMDVGAYATAYSAFAGGDAMYADRWSEVTCPALFLTGSDDPNSTPAMAQTMAALAPRGYARIIDGHRHMVNLTAPDEVNRLLLEWLQLPEVLA